MSIGRLIPEINPLVRPSSSSHAFLDECPLRGAASGQGREVSRLAGLVGRSLVLPRRRRVVGVRHNGGERRHNRCWGRHNRSDRRHNRGWASTTSAPLFRTHSGCGETDLGWTADPDFGPARRALSPHRLLVLPLTHDRSRPPTSVLPHEHPHQQRTNPGAAGVRARARSQAHAGHSARCVGQLDDQRPMIGHRQRRSTARGDVAEPAAQQDVVQLAIRLIHRKGEVGGK